MKMKNDSNFEKITIGLLVTILVVVTHTNWTMREEMSDNANPQTSESIMNDEEITSRDVNGEADLGAHSSAGVGRDGSRHKDSKSNTTTGEVKGEADLGEPASTDDLQTEENEEGLSEPEGAGLNNDNAQRTSEAVGEKVGEVFGQLGDGFRNVIGTLDDKLNDE